MMRASCEAATKRPGYNPRRGFPHRHGSRPNRNPTTRESPSGGISVATSSFVDEYLYEEGDSGVVSGIAGDIGSLPPELFLGVLDFDGSFPRRISIKVFR
jgi:hypothetical protein